VLKVLPEKQVFADYLARLQERPAYQRYAATDFEMARQAGMVGG
jgi:glutathione S-transferase